MAAFQSALVAAAVVVLIERQREKGEGFSYVQNRNQTVISILSSVFVPSCSVDQDFEVRIAKFFNKVSDVSKHLYNQKGKLTSRVRLLQVCCISSMLWAIESLPLADDSLTG